jgi:hypothetical protein
MADVLCPVCGQPNSQELGVCYFCGASLKPEQGAGSLQSQALRPGDEPIKRDTSEFEKVKPTQQDPIHPGDEPTKKNTAELERALPSWLRSLREGKRPEAGESLAEPTADETPGPASPSAPGELPDWLAGLGEAASEDEEIPDWLKGLQGNKALESTPTPEEDFSATGTENEDWMARLGNEPPALAPETPLNPAAPVPEQPAFGATADLGDWLQSLQPEESNADQQPAPAVPPSKSDTDLPAWLSGLAGVPEESSPSFPLSDESDEPAPAENTPDWLADLKKKAAAAEPGMPAAGNESASDWLSGFGSVPEIPAPSSGEKIPDWLANLSEKSGSAPEPPATDFGNQPGETPDWLSRLQSDFNAAEEPVLQTDDFQPQPEAPAPSKGTGPLPEWLTGITPSAPASGGTPALITDNKDNLPSEEGEMAFSLETPEWLSKLNPDQGAEKPAENKAGPPDSENLEAAELPSWVQAMRPVEAVVEPKTTPLDEQVTERIGPLAGLRGVLPAEPGLGTLRKPPVYSSKLLVSDGQQRYAAALERLIKDESNAQPTQPKQLASNRLWRWAITVLLFLAISLPFLSNAQVAPTFLASSDKGASSKVIDSLPANVPVLVAFDYDPALSGEMEAVSAPLMDQLLSRGIPLALMSTSPTGPALAEHFLQTTSLVNVHQYQSGQQYVNLGYLPGGPSGILYLTDSLNAALPVDISGKPAWQSGPLQGIQSVSSFAAVIVLTDNADTGRNWIEQAGPRLGATPLLMVISAQAEPMIRPYFDSGQLKGLVSGLPDAKIYEQTYNRPGLAYHYWNSFSVGMLVAELLIVAGVILGIYFDRRALRNMSKEEA